MLASSLGNRDTQTVIAFGPFAADLRTQELRREGVRLRLPLQSFQILKMLLQRPGELVTREELHRALWPSETFVDFEHGVNAAVNRLRDVLGDSADSPRYVETLPRRGYRFLAPIVAPNEFRASAVDWGRRDKIEVAALPWVSNRFLSALALVGMAAAVSILVLMLRYAGSPRVTRYVQVTNDGVAKVASLCCTVLVNDDSRLYFSEWSASNSFVAQVPLSGGQAVPLGNPLKNVSVLDISRNRSELLVTSQEGSTLENPLRALPLSGGSARRLGNLVVTDASWSPDGQNIVYAKAQALYTARADGSESRKLATLSGVVTRPRWSPKENVIRFTEHNVSNSHETLHPLFPQPNERRDECCGAWTRENSTLPRRISIFLSRKSTPSSAGSVGRKKVVLIRGRILTS